MNKHWIAVLWAGLLTIGLSTVAQAALIDRGNGLIYDDALDITWLQDANYAATQYAATSGAQGDADGAMTWSTAQAWAGGVDYLGYTNWRLPTIGPLNGTSYDLNSSNYGETDNSYNNIQATELGHLFHESLGYLSKYFNWKYGSNSSSVFGASLQRDEYWSGSETSGVEAMYFDMSDGQQSYDLKTREFYALLVSDGDVAMSPVPVPAAVWLFASGLMGMLGFGGFRKHS